MKKLLIALASALAFLDTAQAALVDRGGGMIYDTTRDITWLADMNYAATSGYAAVNAGGVGSNSIHANGTTGWDAAVNWANGLVFGGFSDWRLPTLNTSDATCSGSYSVFGTTYYYGTGCTGGELSHLFVADLGTKASESVLNQVGDTAQQIANLALFSNVQSYRYWSGTKCASFDPTCSWTFDASGNFRGGQYAVGTIIFGGAYSLAVRDGDVAASVPEPSTLALTAAALLGVIATRRRRPATPTA